MRSDTRLDYAIFQLTPTRTRCELYVAAQGSTYKLASGLLKPFIAHLHAAEEQLAKGGYSIRLEPPDPTVASWFTKGTMERFVRFVSTPEVLERVSTVEVEIAELENTIRAQTSESVETNDPMQADDQSTKNGTHFLAGVKTMAPTSLEKSSKSVDGADNVIEESSKQRLLRALDARRTMLQKEQGMAFARAIAAGFSIEHMSDLIAFAECVGAVRLREACTKFVALCKKRQGASLWLEDLDLAASENSHPDMAFMVGARDNTMGFMKGSRDYADAWLEHGRELHFDDMRRASFPVEGKLSMGEDGPEKLTRRGSLDESTGEYWKMAAAGGHLAANGNGGQADDYVGNGEYRDLGTARGPGLVSGHPMLAAWQGQPTSNYFVPNVHSLSSHSATHPSMPVPYGFTGPARAAPLPYPAYLGGSYMQSPYGDNLAWQGGMGHPHSSLPPQYWPGGQAYNSDNPRPIAPEHINGVTMPNGQHQERILTHTSGLAPVKQTSGPSLVPKLAGDGHHQNADQTESSSYEETDVPPQSTRRLPRRSSSPSRRSSSPMRRVQIGRSGQRRSSGMVVIRNINYIAPNAQNQATKENSENESESWSEDGKESDGERDEAKAENKKRDVMETDKWSSKKLEGVMEAAHQKPADARSQQKDSFADDKAAFMMDRSWVGGPHTPQYGLGELAMAIKTKIQLDNSSEGAMEGQGYKDMVMLPNREQSKRLHTAEFMADQERQDGMKMPLTDDSFVDPDSRNIKHMNHSIDTDFEFSGKSAEDLKQQAVDRRPLDDSFMVYDRSATQEHRNTSWRVPFNLESEIPRARKLETGREVSAQSFEPDDLFMVPERNAMSVSRSWNAPTDDMQMFAADMMEGTPAGEEQQDSAADGELELENGRQGSEEDNTGGKPKETSTKKVSERDAKAKAMQEMLERRKGPAGKRSNPLLEAQLRAEKLRTYKADLQKSKKEKEEEERKRIEDLKRQRQERIAARSNPGGGSTQSPSSIAKGSNRTTTPTLTKSSSPKLSQSDRRQSIKGPSSVTPSSLSSRLKASLEGNKVARPPLSSPKAVGNAVSRSVPSISELRKESSSKYSPSSNVRSSTGSTHLSLLKKTEKELESPAKTIAQAEEKKRPASSTIARKGLLATKDSKGESLPLIKVTKPQSSPASKPPQKKPSVRPPAKKEISPAPRQVSVEKITKNESPPVPKSNGIIEVAKVSPVAGVVVDLDNARTPWPAEAMAVVGASTAVEEASELNGALEGLDGHVDAQQSLKKDKEGVSVVGSSVRTGSPAGSDDGHTEFDVVSTVDEDHYAPLANMKSSADDVPAASADAYRSYVPQEFPSTSLPSIAEQHEQFSSDSPLFTPPRNLPRLHEAILQAHSPDASPLNSGNAKSRKKWAEKTPKDHAKGLKRLLLLGRKSSKSTAQNSLDSTSDGDEQANEARDLSSSNGMSRGHYADPEQSLSKSQGDNGSSSSSGKGSRSFFSLSTFRGKSEGKA